MPLQRQHPDAIPLLANMWKSYGPRFDHSREDPCSCGDPSKFPYQDGCKDTGLDEAIEFIQRKKAEGHSPQQPPQKRRRFAEAEALSPKETDPPCIVVFRESIKFASFDSKNILEEAIEYTTFGNDTKTHVAKTGDNVRLIVSESSDNVYKRDLIDVILPMSSADFRSIAVASKVTHLQKGMRETGRFWVETTFTAIEVPEEHLHKLTVTWELKWSTVSSPQENVLHTHDFKAVIDWMIQKLLPTHLLDSDITPQDFYECIDVPPRDDAVALKLKVDGLKSELYPYQGRSVRWMLNREGMDWSPATKSLIPIVKNESVSIMHKTVDAQGQQCWISPIFDLVTTSKNNFATEDVSGGLLLEEMGLGKTIEIISLILLHKRLQCHDDFDLRPMIHDASPDREIIPIKATLIICPPAILKQWEEELERHAPKLRVFVYNSENVRKAKDQTKLLEILHQQDVVLTTYQTIAKEIWHLEPPPARELRSNSHANVRGAKETKKKEPHISPLVRVSWWRTILDEVQMIDGGASKAAHVAKMIPRDNAWGVTGTPVKTDMIGMYSLLDFLRYEPFTSDKAAWKALLMRDQKTFQKICQTIAIRHTKQIVRDEMRLPAQKRYVMRMPLTPIEEQNYRNIFGEMCSSCGIDPRTGWPNQADWNPMDYETKLRKSLLRLRINILYPDLSGKQRQRQHGQCNVKPETAAELLHVMLMDNLSELHSAERKLLTTRIARGKLQVYNTDSVDEAHGALLIWNVAKQETDTTVEAARKWLSQTEAGHDLEQGRKSAIVTDEQEGIIRAAHVLQTAKIAVLRTHLENMLRIQHTAVFMCATGYHTMTERVPETQRVSYQHQEEEHYHRAKTIRQEILRNIHERCSTPMQKFRTKLNEGHGQGGFTLVPTAVQPPSAQLRLSRASRDAWILLEKLSTGFLEHQSVLIDEWRRATVELLCQPLIDDPEQDVTGEEYGNSTQDQEQVVLYVQAFRTLIEDRNDILTGGTNQLTLAEMRDTFHRALQGEGPAPELALHLARKRKNILGLAGDKTFIDLQSEIRRHMTSLRAKVNEEKDDESTRALCMLDSELTRIKAFIAKQTDIIPALRAESAEFTKLMNHRVEYYRQLQTLSDQVGDYDEKTHDALFGSGHAFAFNAPYGFANVHDNRVELLRIMGRVEDRRRAKIAKLSTSRRYLEHLQDPAQQENGLPECVICGDNYEDGSMTVCGHFFCQECIYTWWFAHKKCPVCKKKLKYEDIHYVTHRAKELKVQEEEVTLSGLERNKVAEGIYSELAKKSLDEIMNTPLDAPKTTTKADTLCRHIIWLRKQDPTTKVLVFSQFTGFLAYLKKAFERIFENMDIDWASIEDKNGIERFKSDPSCCIFLLDAKSQSSGLNLVEASHVFLCEPLINTAIELQAISRVDRIGQKRETTVWLYIVDGTVEENIYSISVRRRLEHLPGRVDEVDEGNDERTAPELEKELAAANSAELANVGSIQKLLNPRDKGGGEMVGEGDLMEALFTNVRRRKNVAREMEENQGEEGEEDLDA